MALHQHKCLRRPGLPELTGLLLTAGAVALAGLWWKANAAPESLEVTGRALAVSAELTHYNAMDSRLKVHVQYEYTVGERTFTGVWTGFWPQVMGESQTVKTAEPSLPSQGQALPVFYDPKSPSTSVLLLPDQDMVLEYALMATAGFVLCGLYCCKLYPAWRRLW